MNPFGELSEENHDQIRKYLKFFRQKREGILRAISQEFADATHDRLHEEMFSREDMEEFSEFMKSAVRNQVGHDLGSIINMGALAVSQLLENAQERGVDLVLETAAVENQVLLEAVEKMSLDAMPKTAKRGVGELVSFKDEAKARREETERLETINRRQQDEIESLRKRLQRAEQQSSSASEGKRSEEDASQRRIRELERSLVEQTEEGSKRVSETAQFQQMRKLMQSQSGKIRTLRQRLERYEPDACKEEDD